MDQIRLLAVVIICSKSEFVERSEIISRLKTGNNTKIIYFYKMKVFNKLFVVTALFFSFFLYAQTENIEANEIAQKVAFTVDFAATLNEKYRSERKKLIIDEPLKSELKKLKTLYDSKLEILKPVNYTDNFSSYYRDYPDVSAVLLNRYDQFEGKISDEEKTKINTLLVDIWKIIPNSLYSKASDVTDKINKDRFVLTFPYRFEIFRNYFDDAVRKRNDVINFLLWNLN